MKKKKKKFGEGIIIIVMVDTLDDPEPEQII